MDDTSVSRADIKTALVGALKAAIAKSEATIAEVAAAEAAGARRLAKTGDNTQVPIPVEKNATMGYGPKVPGTSSPKVPGPMGKDEESADEAPTCPTCGGPGNKLGGLGNLAHFRCRDCGHTFSEKAPEKAPKKDKEVKKEEMDKVTPPDVSEKVVHKLKDEYGHDKEGKKKAFATAWKIHNQKAAKKAEIDPVGQADEKASPKAKLPGAPKKVTGDDGSGGLKKFDLRGTPGPKGTSLAMLRHYARKVGAGVHPETAASLASLRPGGMHPHTAEGLAAVKPAAHPSSLEAIRGRSRTAPVVKAENDKWMPATSWGDPKTGKWSTTPPGNEKKPDHAFEPRKKPSRLESDIKTCKNCGKPYDEHKTPMEKAEYCAMEKALISGAPSTPGQTMPVKKAAMGAGAVAKPAAPKAPAAAKPAMGMKPPKVGGMGKADSDDRWHRDYHDRAGEKWIGEKPERLNPSHEHYGYGDKPATNAEIKDVNQATGAKWPLNKKPAKK